MSPCSLGLAELLSQTLATDSRSRHQGVPPTQGADTNHYRLGTIDCLVDARLSKLIAVPYLLSVLYLENNVPLQSIKLKSSVVFSFQIYIRTRQSRDGWSYLASERAEAESRSESPKFLRPVAGSGGQALRFPDQRLLTAPTWSPSQREAWLTPALGSVTSRKRHLLVGLGQHDSTIRCKLSFLQDI